ncbi:MAG: tyrosine recombinase XerC [Chloroflexi bacterium]|nr:tyrosine recombinase XerC [Chloroflexota bacterium]
MPIPASLLERYREYLIGTKGRSKNTVRVYLDDLRSFGEFLERQELAVDSLDRQSLRKYLAWLATSARGRDGGYARVSVARKLVSLRAFYRFLLQGGLVQANPIPKGRTFRIKVDKHLPVFLGKTEVVRLLQSPDLSNKLGIRNRAILELLYSSGVRLSELTALDIKDVDMQAQEMKVWGKGSKERMVLLGRPAVKAVEHYVRMGRPALEQKPILALFLNRYGGRLSRRSVEKIVKRYALEAAISPGVHTHTLRHTFATHMLEGGADLRVVQELLGHSSPATTQIYTHVTQSQARKVYLASHPRAKREKEAKRE